MMRSLCVPALLVGSAWALSASESDSTPEALAEDDTCVNGEGNDCALNALQRHGLKITHTASVITDVNFTEILEAEADGDATAFQEYKCYAGGFYYYPNMDQRTREESPDNCQLRCANTDGCAHFSYWPDGGCQIQDSSSAGRGAGGRYAGVISGPASCDTGGGGGGSSAKCGALDAPENAGCKTAAAWSFTGGKYNINASNWYNQMHEITGVEYRDGTQDDFQRLYFCAPPGGKSCGSPPCSCSKPPCNTCFGGAPPTPKRSGCNGADGGIKCTPPKRPMDYAGMEWPATSYSGSGPFHVFAIGDWGGMDGTLNPIEGRARLIAYKGGGEAGPSVFPRTRWNKYHSHEMCDHTAFTECYGNGGAGQCADTSKCGFVEGVDNVAQLLVAASMQKRASYEDPKFILNVGDNFYWGGIEKNCGTPMNEISFTAHHQFDQIFERVYVGDGLNGKPWFSVLGNHDWGGRQFNNGWDQQIAYTWASTRWVMPAPYYYTQALFPDAGFTIDMFFIDTNVFDAHEPSHDSEHNICGSAHNPPGATCGAIGGPASVATCKGWFDRLWSEQKVWMANKLGEATGNWQIAVTHFPCGTNAGWYRYLHQSLGLDLLVTGHRHDQELHPRMGSMGGLTCFVTGGGGGISSEATPNPADKSNWFGEGQYGFFDLTVSSETILIESINYDGTVLKTYELYNN